MYTISLVAIVVALVNLACASDAYDLIPSFGISRRSEEPFARRRLHGDIAKSRLSRSRKRCSSKNVESSPSAKAPSPPPPPPPSNKKVGLGWSNSVPNALHFWKGPNTGGLYTWSPDCPSQAAQVGIPCFPMLWGSNQIADFTSTVKKGYSTIAIGMNEVNQPGQAQMSPGDGASMWRQYLAPLKNEGYQLVSPSVTNAPSGATWFQQWFDECPDCKSDVDFLNLHYYGTDAQNFIDYVTQMHTQFGKDIWVTEVACENFSGSGGQADQQQVTDFLNTITHWMDQTDYVRMYFWFGLFPSPPGGVSAQNGLMNPDGSPNALGEDYLQAN